MGVAEDAKVRSVLAALTLLALLSHTNGIAEGPEAARLAPGPRAAGQHRRLKRGWIWKQLFVPEEDPTLRVIGQLKSDSDRGEFGIQYILSGEGAGDAFEIDEYSGEIRTLKKLDREEKAFYVLQAQAINRRSQEPEEPQSEFIIKVQDVNDNAPQFPDEPYVASVPEMCPTGTTVVQVTATDADDPMFGNNAKLIYSILQGEPYFSVEPKTGIIVTSWPDMDREAKEEYLVVVQVKDMLGLSGGYSASTTVTVSLSDINDNGPIFQHHLYTFAIPEDAVAGTTVGTVKAEDADTGINARMTYSLQIDLQENATFTIRTDPLTQEGVVLLAKPLDYETKRRYVVVAEAINEETDPRFLPLDEFSDRTTLKIMVHDLDEPPVFLSPFYEWKVAENAAAGIAVGVVSARDTDAANDAVRYSFDKRSDAAKAFAIDPLNGTISIAKALDRETSAWHNVTVFARETTQKRLSSSVVASIKVLDINDNAPQLAGRYQPYVCEGAQAGELIQLLSATDLDEPSQGHHFYFSMVPDKHINPNFTIRDNQDNTAGIVARRSTFTRKDRRRYLLPVVVTDSGSPALSSTATLTISVCSCQPAGHCPSGGVEALALSMGVSLQTFVTLLVCLVLAAALSVLALLLWRHKRKQKGVHEKASEPELPDTVSQKVLYYGEAGPTRDPVAPVPLRPHSRRRERRLAREEVRASIRMSLRESRPVGPEDDVFRQFILDRLVEADGDPYAPPFDRLTTYAYEGSGSSAGSLSSLESCGCEKPAAVPKSHWARLSPWHGTGDGDTVF
ncbi:cadherin-7 isoform X1 [Phyllopteryx taeniolatus]|uniref:cadherin-7 isoform X1 n=1 Tax=Phyllopteryx taeniolatus TaxID=161469 RepID=UPI002AD5A1F5|nr:cadherin-7 isoform X1 [Phyllopteryx taeniolatus]XP_061613658.1 cadherin-7 isoform X1 [Phyllopteryx taeniolatus]XP_061613659.1 cadherin-7 isoform X1 [Phyllopteryx taeniolatus]XP_061613660.1 cadherin-7 isoform X1 [Phyllopteryx taeniolatus]XP_061613661.1 cadherin-7 isoform X1 [Phyllopteryx taeniolatus]XP_061613662.1 cadherin-7 isoform X1 [Phyllopteryx taeniolatus]XP_061613663.1 cadherin-7 isoform X1 [Phyllopteryx taeniolatus]XP_061613664.1 cadherin-7 isoform X1 [Phyllopteryx taeniolatus]XP_